MDESEKGEERWKGGRVGGCFLQSIFDDNFLESSVPENG